MEDEEEIQSYQNGRPPLPSPLPSSSQPVTVAAAPPQHTLTLALPIQQPKPTAAGVGAAGTGGGGSGGGGGREDCWSEGATSVLIEAWGERYLELSRGNLKQKHWKEVAEIVSGRDDYTKPSKTDVQCKNRIDTLKKKYKQEKGKIASGQGPSKWPFFHRLDHLIGPNSKIASATGAFAATSPNPTAAVAAGNTPMPATPMLLPGAKVPTAIPVGLRSLQKPQPLQSQRLNLLQQHLQQQQQRQQQQQQFRRSTESNSSRSAAAMGSPESSDSFPPEPVNRKRGRIGKESRRRMRMKGNNNNNNWGNSIRELTRAILEFGEAYERAETSKLQEIVEMEKQRMGFAKELELQRMQFFMNTQLELTQLKHQQGRRGGGGGNGLQNHHHQHSNNNRNNNSSD